MPERVPRGLGLPRGIPSAIGRIAKGSYRIARRLIVALVGASVVLVGLVLLIAPGPAFVVIPIGLGILALEFVWARRLLRLFRVRARQAHRAYQRGDRGFLWRWLGRRPR